jgi:hypothetical protein
MNMPQLTVCKICDEPTRPFASATILRKHRIAYFRCGACGFIQTESPYWLDEAYSDPIVLADVGLVGRNLQSARVSRTVIRLLFDARGRFLDYGGGYGMFVRLMRDQGFDFYRYDPHCKNLFAHGFDADPAGAGQYELLTAFEVFEHLAQPVDGIQAMLGFAKNILFSTLLVPEPAPQPEQWWYYALEGGQHISLYTKASLHALASRFGLYLASCGDHLHLLTQNRWAPRLFKYACKPRYARIVDLFSRKRPSLLSDDYRKLTGISLG